MPTMPKLSLIMRDTLYTIRYHNHRQKCEDVAIEHVHAGSAKALKKRGLIDIVLVSGGAEFCRLTPTGKALLAAGPLI